MSESGLVKFLKTGTNKRNVKEERRVNALNVSVLDTL